MMTRDAKKIVAAVNSALAASIIYNPQDMRQAIEQLATTGTDDDERAVVTAFVNMLKNRVENKERILRETYS